MARLPQRAGQNSRALKGKGLWASFGYALEGLTYAWHAQPNFRIETLIGLFALALAIWLGISPVPILLASMAVLGLELLNTALEAMVDLASPSFHPLAKAAKDAAAAAVLLAALLALVVGLYLLGPPLWERIVR